MTAIGIHMIDWMHVLFGRVAEARASWWGGGPEALGGLGLGTIAEREAAFQRGYAAGDPKVCLAS